VGLAYNFIGTSQSEPIAKTFGERMVSELAGVRRQNMPNTSSVLREETDSLLEKLTPEKREYLLWRLASEKLANEKSEPIPVRRPEDGTVVGYLRRLAPPSDEEQALMLERAKRTDPLRGNGARGLLESMKADDVESVESFIH
jgi:hypothetical protein